ncbi:unnamed protein product [Rotaria sordida]|uniref:Uncharacterized protein n=1 Tax=Rotaria sordida TaxID=392033 RepID=A0A818Z7P1_9BILA|nr:unnamed protein product [Rotaria sordida]CAF1212313.1 unnamed protein product [Rotaria sordida]CAF3689289.1 unnamed protein product [Rotaria sordida]CAF3766257.1 unnamed protein product [Rotaria sordida]
MRYDMLFRTHLWDSLFDIEPKKTTLLSTNSFDLYDMRYTARYSQSTNILYIPDCDHWGGINDQFGITDSALYSALYPDRGRLDVLRSLYASAHKLRFRFHAETTLRARAEQLNVSIIKLPMCYSNIRLYPKQPYLCSFVKPVAKTVKGYGCCKQFCIDIKHHMQQRNAAMDNSITLEKYTKKLGIRPKARNEHECLKSLRIIQRTKKPLSHAATSEKNRIEQGIDEDEEDEEYQNNNELEANKENEIQTFNEISELKDNDDS